MLQDVAEDRKVVFAFVMIEPAFDEHIVDIIAQAGFFEVFRGRLIPFDRRQVYAGSQQFPDIPAVFPPACSEVYYAFGVKRFYLRSGYPVALG